MSKAISKETGATEDEVNSILGMFLPTFEDAIAEEEPGDAGALQRMFKKEEEGIKKKSPSLTRMAMKAIF